MEHNIWWFRFVDNPKKNWTVVKSHDESLLLFRSDKPKGYYQPINWDDINKLEYDGTISCIKAGRHCKHCLHEEVVLGLCLEHMVGYGDNTVND